MSKINSIIAITWQKALTYRFTITSYRIGEIVEIIFLVAMWSALYRGREIINGYTLPQILTYIIIGNLIGLITRNFMPEIVAREIKDGTLSLFLVKPITYFRYAFIREFGRVTLPFCISLVTQFTLILFFWNKLLLTAHIATLAVLILIVAVAFVSELLLGYLIGLIAFWTTEVDGLYATIDRLRKFLSGGYFPLSLLPALYIKISFALPFAYSFFVPTQLYLGKISITEALTGIITQLVWILILYCIILFVWHRGIRRYEGVGI